MTANAAVVLRDRGSGGEDVVLGMRAARWDLYEVWLSRIKQPRDRAAISLAAGFSNPTSDLSR